MSDQNKPAIGSIGWFDLTVENAEEIREFYASVTGWKTEPLSMGEYNDYVMKTPAQNTPVAGVCHARGSNAGLPPQWLMYITVDNIEASVAACLRLGGQLITPIKKYGDQGKYCVIQDPAGAFSALFQP